METKKSLVNNESPICVEIIACLHECFEDLESGDPARIAGWNSDPYFEREPAITQEDADRLIAALDKRLDVEIEKYPIYHANLSGANAYTALHRLPPSARLGLAQRLARICDRFE